MFDFHSDSKRYFDMQYQNCKNSVIPFITTFYPLKKDVRVLEIGCADAGVLKAFLEQSCQCVGIELYPSRLEKAFENLAEYIAISQVKLVASDIFKITSVKDLGGKFDIIILKDVIEHISNQKKLINQLQSFLNQEGVIFFGFPPWQMPFGGHHQICRSKFLSRFPYIHLLPMPIYKWVMRNETKELFEIKKTGISIERFERIIKESNYRIIGKRHFLINPIYQYKFNIKERKQRKIISSIPFVRNFLTTAVFYLIQIK
jgi:2-polyprenyl-3-methyl-5-hydroxy-6-metoxy-1,4-benzoquinol methylase